MTIQRLYRVILLIRYALLGLAIFFIFVLDWNRAGLALALTVLAIGIALRIAPVRIWLVRHFTDEWRPKPRTAAAAQPPTAPEAEMTEAEIERLLAEEARPAILLQRHWPPGDPAPQNSWLGGLPRLPDGVAWPENPQTGLALHHLAQIDLAEMPRIETETPLPAQGMLWFFADIDEELVWDEGPGMPQARVIYHDRSTAEVPMRPAPDNLPQVDHPDSEMQSKFWSFRSARMTIFPRWPVTGHATTTWPQDSLPNDVTWNSPYPAAREARMKAALAAIRGEPPEPAVQPPGIYQPETVLSADGTTQRPTGKFIYCPDAFGAVFPYHNALGFEVLHALRHKPRAKLSHAEGTLRWTPGRIEKEKERGGDVSRLLARMQAAEQEAATCRNVIAQISLVHDLLAAAPESKPLTTAHQRQFDALMRGPALGPETEAGGRQAVQRGLQRIVQRSFDMPELLALLPAPFVAGLRGSFLPTAGAAQHFLMGAKGIASNPTAGFGRRLAQFDSDDALDFMFCDVGIIDFWIDPKDLAAGRWGRAWAATAGG